MSCEYVVLIRDAIALRNDDRDLQAMLERTAKSLYHVKEAEPHSVVSMVRK